MDKNTLKLSLIKHLCPFLAKSDKGFDFSGLIVKAG